jgi:hypothetical protein
MFRRAAFVFAAAISISTAVAADSADVWASREDAAKRRGQTSAFVVVFAKEDSALFTKTKESLADKKLAKVLEKGFVAVRLDVDDEGQARALGLSPERKECLAILDGFGVKVARQEKESGPDALAKLIKQAQDATAKKKALEKKLEGALAKAKQAIEKQDTKAAADALQQIAGYGEQLPCEPVEQAKAALAELEKKGLEVLEKSRAAIRKGDYSTAQKALSEALASFPLPGVQKEAQKVREELAQATRPQK